ncbi:MAG: hypothetical protein HYV63_21055 [Candidatus Schekmanbacteria bacterium]|nr:hypothetical protein [Candidatus Schekmanbacteria bacterium]
MNEEMMEITLTLPRDFVRQLRHDAEDRELMLSTYVHNLLTQAIREGYSERAMFKFEEVSWRERADLILAQRQQEAQDAAAAFIARFIA